MANLYRQKFIVAGIWPWVIAFAFVGWVIGAVANFVNLALKWP